jgi:hypothetical protein
MSDITRFTIDSEALEAAMKERWGDPDKIAGLIPPSPEPDPTITPEPEDELDLGLGDDDTDDNDDDESTEPEVEDEVEGTTPPSPPSDLIPLGDGRYLTKEQIEYYANLDARFAQDQAFREHIQNFGKAPVKPAELPPEIDLDDPATKYLYDRMQEMERRLAQTGQVVTLTQQQQQEELDRRTTALVNRVAASFQQQHELTDAQMKELRTAAAHVGGVDRYMSGVHPVTGEIIPNPDIMSAIDTALTIAFRAREDFVTSSTEKVVRRQLDNKQRKARLNKIGGNSGSTPRTPQIPTDAPGRRAAMLEEVRGLMNGQQA